MCPKNFDQVRPDLSRNPFFDSLRAGTIIKIYEKGTDDVLQRYDVASFGPADASSNEKGIPIVLKSGKEEIRLFVVNDELNRDLYFVNESGVRQTEFDGEIEFVNYQKQRNDVGDHKRPKSGRSIVEILVDLELRDKIKRVEQVFDQNGKLLCEVDFDPRDGKISEIRTVPYANLEQEAEHFEEMVYVTDQNGDITEDRLTRGQVRDQKKRYLVVTTLIFNNKEMLLQERSKDKKIDPGKLSASAHGVAKEIVIRGTREKNVDTVSLINSAIEINEELRCGNESKPFVIKVWNGTMDELLEYAEHKKIDDPNTVYLIPLSLKGDSAYPLVAKDNERSRAISIGFILSKDKPQLSLDSSEVSGAVWVRMSKVVGDERLTDDVQQSMDYFNEKQFLESRQFQDNFASDLLHKKFGV